MSSKEVVKQSKEQLPYSKAELSQFLGDIAERVVDSNTAYIHSVLALNEIFRSPQIDSVLDDDLRSQLRDLWVKLKSAGLELGDPPLLFETQTKFEEEEREVIAELPGDELGEEPKGSSAEKLSENN